MKKRLLFGILLLFYSLIGFAQDCSTQIVLSADISVCSGDNALITILNSDPANHYQLRNGATDVGAPLQGNGGALDFTVTPPFGTATTYSVYSVECDFLYVDTVIITAVEPVVPVTDFSYGSPFCPNNSNPFPIPVAGFTAGGTFSSTAGLSLNGTTGEIDLSSSTSGSYIVTYSVAASGCNPAESSTYNVTITAVPTASISYAGNPICISDGNQSVSLSGTGAYTGGTYSSTAGLTINAVSGLITPGTSTAGSYVVTYTIPASGGCASVPVTTNVTITAVPAASISYSGTPFCKSDGNQNVNLTGTGAYTGGLFSAAAGLDIDSATGTITPANSTAGTYTVTYTVAASGGCVAVPVTTSVTITAVPTATINYATAPFCKSNASAQAVTRTGTGAYLGGTYSSTAGLVINPTTGAITPSTSTVGTYIVTYTIPASAGCAAVDVTTSVTITAVPTAAISYAGTPFCKSDANESVTLTGTGAYAGGVFSAAAGLDIDAVTGEISPATSTAGIYTVTYTIPASGGCGIVNVTTSVTVTSVPTVTINYATAPFCKNNGSSQLVTRTGTGAFSGGTYSASPAGLSINATSGAIIPSTSAIGTYTVTYTTPASGGCAAVDATAIVTITPVPTAVITYATPFCSSDGAQSVTLTGTGAYTGGTFSAPAGLNINSVSGDVNPSASTPGTYIVTYTIPASGGCSAVAVTRSITITTNPTAAITYAGNPICTNDGNQNVTLTGTGAYTGGTFSSSPAGLIMNTAGRITPSTSTPGTYTVTYTTDPIGGCPSNAVTTNVTITAVPTATITYTGSPFCKSLATPQSVTLTGTGAYTGGTFSSTAGLDIDSSTGDINPSNSVAGNYIVTYTIPASGGCAAVAVTRSITITAVPTAVINYAGSPYCRSIATAQVVTRTGTGAYLGGVYTASPVGLNINSGSGSILPSGSTAGTYTVTYTIPASAGCAAVPVTTSVTITAVPTATISYAGTPFCKSDGVKSVTLNGTGAYTGGIFSAGAGLDINAVTGEITPTTSTAGTYTITYTIPASAGCAAVPVTTSVTITAVPTVSINYAGSPFCRSTATGAVTRTGTGAYLGGSYSSTAGLTINASTGVITPSTSTAGTYVVTYTTIASGGCAPVSVTTNVTITAVPTAAISYTGTPFCKSLTSASVTLSGTGAYTGGTYSSAAGLSIDSATGEINPSLSTAGTYTVTYTVPASGGCAAVPVTTSVTITAVPTATISYAGAPFCKSNTLAQAVTRTGTGAYLGGTYSASPAGLIINPTTGAITPSTSAVATYTVTYTIPASAGCAAVPVTTSVTITAVPTATISYATAPFCKSDTSAQNVSLTGTGAFGGGSYSATPAGLNINAATGAITPSASTVGTYTVTYTVPASGGCAAVPVTTSVTVTAVPTASISYAGSPFCISTPPSNVTLTGTGAYTGGTYSAAPAGLTIHASTGVITPTSSAIGTYTVTYTIPASGGCAAVPVTTTVVVDANAIGGTLSLSNSSVVTATTECFTASGTLYLTGEVGTITKWQYSTTAGTSWIDIPHTGTTYAYSNVTESTIFRVAVQNTGGCVQYSTMVAVYVIPNIKPSPVIATPSTICVGGSSTLTATSGYATSGTLASGGAFQNSNPEGWFVDNCTNNCLNAGASNTSPGPWQLSATNGGTYSGTNYIATGKFAIVNGNFDSQLYTPVFNTLGLTSATLNFNHGYNLVAGATGTVEISVNGGPWVVLSTYGPGTGGVPNLSVNGNIDLSAYLGQVDLQIRFNYNGTAGSSWAVDNIQIPQAPVNLNTQWVDATTGIVISNATSLVVSPVVTTTYAVTSYLNGCNSFGTEGTAYVTVTVNPRPTAVISEDHTICYGATATFSVALTGVGPWNLTYSNGTTSTSVTNILTSPYVFNIPNVTSNQTYSITALSDSRCTSIAADIAGSATVTVLNGTAGLWTGLISTDWFDCRNWSGGLPSPTIDAVIPTGAPRMPIIDPLSPFAGAYSFIATARDITISAGATVTMTANSNLYIKRDWMNSGSFIPGTGKVTFNSSTANQVQYMNAAVENNFTETYYNLSLECSNGAKGVNTQNLFRLTVINDLTLTSGDLRLTGEAQLIQNGTTGNPVGGTGSLLRDQQGTKSSFHYNYWSSPVSPDNATYTVGGILKDGTDVTTDPFAPGSISFGSSIAYADGAYTSPIKISTAWIYKYTMASTNYYNWQHIGSTGSVKVGEGFTMKGNTGTAPNTDYQNYVFKGKPNNGDITLNIALNQLYLIGNPYASALDADSFIRDNILDGGNASSNVFNGALYFWDHFGGQSHYLAQYVGGYATYTLMGGVVAISNDPLINNNNATGTKVPKRYIPVAQGFFIRTDVAGAALTNPVTGGPVKFRNNQRAFRTESPANSVFFRNEFTEAEDIDNRQKIRLAFETPSGLRRQLLVGADEHATNHFDIGYDGPMIDVNPEDMYWSVANGKLVIQAVPDFNTTQIIPIGVKVNTAGTSKFKIDELINIPASTEIYLHDAVTGLYHDIKNEEFTAALPIGEYTNRFSLRFTSQTLSEEEIILNNGIMVFTGDNEILNIKNNLTDVRVETVQLFNILGQSIAKWDVTDEEQNDIKLPVDHISSGSYIVKLQTTGGSFSKKVIIK